jgi:hypothetical protein
MTNLEKRFNGRFKDLMQVKHEGHKLNNYNINNYNINKATSVV